MTSEQERGLRDKSEGDCQAQNLAVPPGSTCKSDSDLSFHSWKMRMFTLGSLGSSGTVAVES